MKRSEMLDILEKLSEVGSRDAADCILTTLERAGMAPPKVTYFMVYEYFDKSNSLKDYVEYQLEKTKDIHEWEPEDLQIVEDKEP